MFKLTDSKGNGLAGGVVKCYSSGWKDFGTTDENGELHKEMLPSKYTFRMEYAAGKQT